jgi:hypothetical protein
MIPSYYGELRSEALPTMPARDGCSRLEVNNNWVRTTSHLRLEIMGVVELPTELLITV